MGEKGGFYIYMTSFILKVAPTFYRAITQPLAVRVQAGTLY